MCGINLILDKNNCLDSDYALQKMNNVLRHRGPDANIAYTIPFNQATVYLGYVQLALQDKKANIEHCSKTESGSHYLAFNGEIYNHKKLRNTNSEYHTHSDSETLLHYLTGGTHQLDQLEGMFAFVFVDAVTKKITMARDRHGIKPLYYYEDDNYLIVSSEIKSIHATGLIDKKPNTAQIYNYLRFRHAAKPYTMYEGIMQLQEQERLVYRDGKTQLSQWKVENTIPSDIKTEESLVRSIWQCMSGDANVGLMLSGGVDSTLLLAIMKEIQAEPVPCYSITTKRDAFYGTSDSEYAHKAATRFGGEFLPLELDRSCFDRLPEFVAAMDQPIGDGAHFLTWLLSEYASKKTRVLLNGAGADELFAGYNRHTAFAKYIHYFHTNGTLRSALKTSQKLFPSPAKQKFIRSISANAAETFINMTASNLQFPQPATAEHEWVGDLLNQALLYDKQHFLIDDVLALTDHATMQHSIEARVPYLDNNLCTLLGNMTSDHKTKEGPKWILKYLLETRNGKEISQRKKEGFGVQFGAWMLERTSFFDDLLNANNPIYAYLPFAQVYDMVEAQKTTKVDHKVDLWSLRILSEWLKQF